ncbi:ArgS-related anticodon-binding protein NrtL [Streptomyces sp. enrichment culture]|uniref:ArgS-related anticodon-binding protein NrtL n=1 Tax=Streptomyces sp. enrichment culture TaxID=1795815 RepID=UPI003F56584A
MTPVELSRTVLYAVRRAVDAGELSVAVPARAVVTPPGPGGCGDYATNIALQLARPAGTTPRRVAEVLRHRLVEVGGIADVVLTGPGFINICLDDDGGAAGAGIVAEVLRRGDRYGYAETADGAVVQVHCADELRAVVVGETVGRLLRAQGVRVRTSAAGRVGPLWVDVLGVRVEAAGGAPVEGAVRVRPVPVVDVDGVLALGRDAGRWALLRPAGHDRVRGGEEWLVQRESNSLFRVRYAHARTRALHRNAADLGFSAAPGPLAGADAGAGGERAVLSLLSDHPRVLAAAAEHRAPDRLARHLVAVADAALLLLPGVLPRGGEKPSAAHRARLALAEAVGAVLAGGLSLLGIDAPDHL